MKAIHTSTAPAITVAQLEASYPAYCKALRMLVQDGLSQQNPAHGLLGSSAIAPYNPAASIPRSGCALRHGQA
jgi:hypothetical protein